MTGEMSKHDRMVLDAVFGGNTAFFDNSFTNRPLIGDDEHGAFELDVKAVDLAEAGQLQEAFDMLSQSIEMAPQLPSAWNNRAQLRRLLNHHRDLILEDLNTCIDFCFASSSDLSISNCQFPLVARQAFTQRAWLHLSISYGKSLDDVKNLQLVNVSSVCMSGGESKGLLDVATSELSEQKRAYEEAARMDFERAAAFGDAQARKMAAQLNPYAKLCAAMVAELMESEKSLSFHS